MALALLAACAAGAQTGDHIVVSLDGTTAIGSADARLTLVEFSDYQCGFCSRHTAQTFPQILADYIKTGKVRYVVRDFPLDSIHPAAAKAAEGAHCAGEQGKYWEMHTRLLANRAAVDRKDLPTHAQALGLDAPRFEKCVDSGKYASRVRRSLNGAQQIGIDATPTFFLGYTEKNSPMMKVVLTVRGAHPYPAFKQAIETLLSR